MLRRFFFCVPLLAALVACGGGGGGASPSLPPAPVSTPSSAPSNATVQFTVGQNQSVQIVRAPNYISPRTLSVAVTYGEIAYTVDFIQGSAPCTGAIPKLVCTVQVTAPEGMDTFGIAAYDSYAGAGQVLSKTYVTVNVVSGVNNVHAVLDGVPADVSVQKAINVPEGVATSVPFTVTAYDADGAAIVGPGNYTAAVGLTDNDSGGGTSVTAKVSGPGAQPVLTYNGTSAVAYGSYVIANANGIATQGSGTGVIRVVPQYTQYNTPSGRNAIAVASASDGSMWVMEGGGVAPTLSMAIAHVGANGVPSEMPLSSSLGQGVASMIVGPDGALWCSTGPMHGASAPEILSIDSGGAVTSYTNAQMDTPGRIIVGPDNRLWFVERGGIGAIDTSGNLSFYAYPSAPNGLSAVFSDIAVGPDGNLWATEAAQGGLLRVTTSGTMTYFPMPAISGTSYYALPNAIAAQGSMLDVASNRTIYQFDTSGNVLKTYELPSFAVGGMTRASNGSMWVPIGDDVAGGSVIARLSSAGTLSTIAIPYPNDPGITAPYISRIAGAADGSMWYARDVTYGRIVVH